jgi:hypothetical protein
VKISFAPLIRTRNLTAFAFMGAIFSLLTLSLIWRVAHP